MAITDYERLSIAVIASNKITFDDHNYMPNKAHAEYETRRQRIILYHALSFLPDQVRARLLENHDIRDEYSNESLFNTFDNLNVYDDPNKEQN